MCFFDSVGTLGEWIGGLGTVAAFGLTARSLIRTNKQAAADRRETELLQARCITANVEAQGTHLQVFVSNHSAQPVFAVRVLGVRVGPDDSGVILHGDDFWPQIPPSGQGSVLLAGSHPGTAPNTIGAVFRFVDGYEENLSADIEFVDWTGRAWVRRGNHDPEKGREIPKRLPDNAPQLRPIHPPPTLFNSLQWDE